MYAIRSYYEFLNENDLSYKVTGIPKEIKLGDKIKIKSQITNTSNRSYKIANNGSQIFIFVYKSSEEEPVWTTGLHNVNLYAGIPKKAELEYTFDDTGEYIIKIKSVFSAEYKKKRKDYSIEILSQTINIE